MKYLTEKDRYLIEKLLQKKAPVVKIADTIGCCRATVYNEIQRGTYGAKGKLFLPYFPRGDRSHRSGIPYQCPADQSRKTSGGIFSGDPGDRAEDRICVIGAFFQNLPKCLWCQSQ